MARGWESKSVAEQMEDADRALQMRDTARLTREESIRLDKLETLRMSRARLLEQLDRARNAAHRATLNAALMAVEKETAELSQSVSSKTLNN
jgi:hypothetical protein